MSIAPTGASPIRPVTTASPTTPSSSPTPEVSAPQSLAASLAPVDTDTTKQLASSKNVASQVSFPDMNDSKESSKVNLVAPLIGAIASILGGLGGAAYSQDLSDSVNKGLDKATSFIGKHGDAYSLNPFGGANDQKEKAEEAERLKKSVSQNGNQIA
ncbi:MAG: hypothetical protein H7263_14980 [Candidatus Sericytochromatia bacterium]|nr:hypothetical protein [Candidatus Sericytochromatia bacterium]